MTMMDALLDEVKDAPDAIVAETLDFVRFLKHQRVQQEELGDWTEQEMYDYTTRSLQYAAHLYGDEADLLPVEEVEKAGGEINVAAR